VTNRLREVTNDLLGPIYSHHQLQTSSTNTTNIGSINSNTGRGHMNGNDIHRLESKSDDIINQPRVTPSPSNATSSSAAASWSPTIMVMIVVAGNAHSVST
jgi:hypothetical protein